MECIYLGKAGKHKIQFIVHHSNERDIVADVNRYHIKNRDVIKTADWILKQTQTSIGQKPTRKGIRQNINKIYNIKHENVHSTGDIYEM